MDYLGEPSVFKPEQVVAMLLTQLKKVGEMNLGSKVTDCVISVCTSSHCSPVLFLNV